MTDFIPQIVTSPVITLTAWGQSLWTWLAPTYAWTAALLVGALLIDRVLARRARAAWRIALYAPIALRLLLPLSWKIPLANAPRVVTLLTPVPEAMLPPHPALVAVPMFTWQAALTVAWIAVACALVFVRVRARLRLRRELASSRSANARVPNAPCEVVEHEALGPMVVGALRPRIVVPTALFAPEEKEALACVLGHEAAHVRRRDPWLMVAMQILEVAFWPVVPLWIAARRVRALVEMACDEAALADADANARRRYGHTLLDMAEWRTMTVAPLGAGELHFGSTLRARIEALASARRWPRVVQATLVAIAVVAFAACSSVGSAPTTGDPNASSGQPARGQAWSPPPSGAIRSEADLLTYCGIFLDRTIPFWNGGREAYRNHSTDGVPADQVAFCRSPVVLDFVDATAWASEGRNALGQIGKDLATAYEQSYAVGKYELCPSGPPIPRIAQTVGTKYQPSYPADWNDKAGWQCLNFGMDQPMWFQYKLDSDGQRFTATARAQRRDFEGKLIDVTMVLRGEIDARTRVFNIAPTIEETWKTVTGG